MSTFSGAIREFPDIQIDNFTPSPSRRPLAYFLSHVHSDHTKGLEAFRSPVFIYCSVVTKELLLRMEKIPKRLQYDRGILEAKEKHFRELKKMLRPLPLNAPATIELKPGRRVTVTLFDANHCPGAVMFLIEGGGKSVLYTGDIRAEPWWIDALLRQPAMVGYAAGLRQIDNLYLDTAYARKDPSHLRFPSKASGIRSLIDDIRACADGQVFHLRAWTFGYEEVWEAIAAAFSSKIHVDRYHFELYNTVSPPTASVPVSEHLGGFYIGLARNEGVLSTESWRFHACRPECDALRSARVVRIIPIVGNGLEEPAAPLKWVQLNESSEIEPAPRQIAFPFARHSSYEELCRLVQALQPNDIYPCTVDEENWTYSKSSMRALFGHVCSASQFAFDEEMEARGADYGESGSENTQSQLSYVGPGSANRSFSLDTQDVTTASQQERGHIQAATRSSASPPNSPLAKRQKLHGNDDSEFKEQPPSERDIDHRETEQPEAADSQLTLPDSAFMTEDSQEAKDPDVAKARLLRRQQAYRAARSGDAIAWQSVCELEPTNREEEIEL